MKRIFFSDDLGAFLRMSAIQAADNDRQSGKFRKEVIKIGEYVVQGTGQQADEQFEVTSDVLARWVSNFRRMRDNGVKVPIPLGHDFGHDNNRGWVTDLFVDGDSLVMACELFDQDVASLVARNDVSISAVPDFVDGKGKKYDYAITHVALTPIPLIPGLADFVPIAASFGKEKKMTLDLKALGADIGIEAELTDGNAKELILAHVHEMKGKIGDATKELTTLRAELAEHKTNGRTDGGPPKEEVTPTVLKLVRKNVEMQLEQRVANGNIVPGVREKFHARIIGQDGKALKGHLDRGNGDLIDGLLEDLAGNDPVILGEQLGGQTIALADPNRGQQSDLLVKNAEARAAAVQGKPGWTT
jgi:hypothetical protein